MATPQRSITKRVPPSQNTTLPGGRSLFWDGQGHDETTAHIGVCFSWGPFFPSLRRTAHNTPRAALSSPLQAGFRLYSLLALGQ
ncbi:hypothetical protein QIS74_07535 [Colletotrichum tabaci]|uniref:Uncharacterized protein n=1 Tax=Colletotrichum tabaci TaxID=1209068 RepID=A0AAV9TBM5_9PEZI